ncbi:hypothetical protein L798_14460 [Zootermopsis nevadensis]|uniref:Uncharacterized protein n=1 Tax=Zootermopsis nevadensis TaxID=136037 RepID=A0A067QNR3_ZOONE|nr:hypothetical protein L798_14460 [Zootermopsis nevadensis]
MTLVHQAAFQISETTIINNEQGTEHDTEQEFCGMKLVHHNNVVQWKDDETDGNTDGKMIILYKIVSNIKGQDLLGHLDVNGRMILKWTFIHRTCVCGLD